MQRILLIGSPGSGKSTLSKQLQQKLNLPLYHLDKLYWLENWQMTSEASFDRQLHDILQQPAWIIDGNYSRTLPDRLAKSDTVIYLNYSRWTSLYGVLKRLVLNWNQGRSDMGGNNKERFDWEFIRYVWAFNRTQRQIIYDCLATQPEVTLFVFRSRRQLKDFLKKL